MKSSNNREVNSSLLGFKDQVTQVSYVPKQNKSVLAGSTMHHDASVAGEVHKSEIILHYNVTKSGLDNFDQQATMFTARRKVGLLYCSVTALMLGVWLHSSCGLSIFLSGSHLRDDDNDSSCWNLHMNWSMPQVQRQSLIPTLQVPIHMAMKTVSVVDPAQP